MCECAYVCMCMHFHTQLCLYHCVCGDERTTCSTWFSPSTGQGPGIELRSSDMAASDLIYWAISLAPVKRFSRSVITSYWVSLARLLPWLGLFSFVERRAGSIESKPYGSLNTELRWRQLVANSFRKPWWLQTVKSEKLSPDCLASTHITTWDLWVGRLGWYPCQPHLAVHRWTVKQKDLVPTSGLREAPPGCWSAESPVKGILFVSTSLYFQIEKHQRLIKNTSWSINNSARLSLCLYFWTTTPSGCFSTHTS